MLSPPFHRCGQMVSRAGLAFSPQCSRDILDERTSSSRRWYPRTACIFLCLCSAHCVFSTGTCRQELCGHSHYYCLQWIPTAVPVGTEEHFSSLVLKAGQAAVTLLSPAFQSAYQSLYKTKENMRVIEWNSYMGVTMSHYCGGTECLFIIF